MRNQRMKKGSLSWVGSLTQVQGMAIPAQVGSHRGTASCFSGVGRLPHTGVGTTCLAQVGCLTWVCSTAPTSPVGSFQHWSFLLCSAYEFLRCLPCTGGPCTHSSQLLVTIQAKACPCSPAAPSHGEAKCKLGLELVGIHALASWGAVPQVGICLLV